MRARRGVAGFTLFEALVSVALMGLIVASLSAVTGQWLPNWRHGFGRVQSLESLDVGLQRLVDDLEAAEFVTANSQSKSPLFIGDAASVTLVRAAIGPDVRPHLEVVHLGRLRTIAGSCWCEVEPHSLRSLRTCRRRRNCVSPTRWRWCTRHFECRSLSPGPIEFGKMSGGTRRCFRRPSASECAMRGAVRYWRFRPPRFCMSTCPPNV